MVAKVKAVTEGAARVDTKSAKTGQADRRKAGRRRAVSAAVGTRGLSARTAKQTGNTVDPARRVAFDVLQRVSQTASFANLILPKELTAAGLDAQAAGFVTDLVYGTLRWRGLLDAIIEAAARRPLAAMDVRVLDIVRLGAYQSLFMAVPAYAAVSTSVGLTARAGRKGLSGFVNAVVHRISARSRQEWESLVVSRIPKDQPTARLATRFSHPQWIVDQLGQSLRRAGRPDSELAELLAADNQPAAVSLVARPGLVSPDELAAQVAVLPGAQVQPGRWSPYALLVKGTNPAAIPAVEQGLAGVEDEGSQLAALILAEASVSDRAVVQLDGRRDEADSADAAPDSAESAWLDLCAGPGGKTALLGAIAAGRGIGLWANEPSGHRAELVRHNVRGLPEGTVRAVMSHDGRELGSLLPAFFDRVLVDAPCSGLGALRRRPEARWVKRSEDIEALVQLQRELLVSALAALKPGGLLAYVTCSPVLAETRQVVDWLVGEYSATCQRLDAAAVLQTICPALGPLPTGDIQLFSHLQGTDQMFISLVRKL